MKRTIIVVLIIALVAGLAVYFYSKGIRLLTEEVTPGMEEVEEVVEVVEVDYPTGDMTPEHLAEVLGSYSRYEELRDSELRKPDTKMKIVYDTYGTYEAVQGKVAWVSLVMRGEIVNIERRVIIALSRRRGEAVKIGEAGKIEGRVITITNKGETISLYVPEFAGISTDETEKVIDEDGKVVMRDGKVVWRHLEAKFEDIKIGDWLFRISVIINAALHPQARSITIATLPWNIP